MEAVTSSVKDAQSYNYVGWIPCISGHLDFSRMNVGLHGVFMPGVDPENEKIVVKTEEDRNRAEVNFAASGYPDSHHRRVLLQSWVDWRDTASGNGQARVVVCAEVNTSDSLDERFLSGRILMFPRSYKNRHEKQHSTFMNPVGELKRDFDAYMDRIPARRQVSMHEDFQASCNLKWDAIRSTMYSKKPLGDEFEHLYVMDFVVSPHGFLFLKFIDSDLDATEAGVTDEDRFTASRQAFYYLKYAVHKHKHHEVKVDALTTIVPWGDKAAVPGMEGFEGLSRKSESAGLKLIGQLKRELTSIKRARQEDGRLDDATPLGIIGYLRSLINSSRASNVISIATAEREKEWVNGTAESFRAQQAKLDQSEEKARYHAQSARQLAAVFITVLSLLLLNWTGLNRATIAEFKSPGGEDKAEIPFLLNFIDVQPDYFPFMVAVALIAVWWVIWTINKWLVINDSGRLRRLKIETSLRSALIDGVCIIAALCFCFWAFSQGTL